MAKAAARKKQGGFLPRGAEAVLRRMAVQAIGLVVIAVGLGIIAALLTYTTHDPSYNTATGSGPIANALGRTGSYVADALLQAPRPCCMVAGFCFPHLGRPPGGGGCEARTALVARGPVDQRSVTTRYRSG